MQFHKVIIVRMIKLKFYILSKHWELIGRIKWEATPKKVRRTKMSIALPRWTIFENLKKRYTSKNLADQINVKSSYEYPPWKFIWPLHKLSIKKFLMNLITGRSAEHLVRHRRYCGQRGGRVHHRQNGLSISFDRGTFDLLHWITLRLCAYRYVSF